MKRVCFDIASSYWHSLSSGIYLNTPSDARAHFEGKTFTFHAATAYDSSSRKFRDFTNPQKLFECILRADEIITYNGRICDYIVLEKLFGEEPMRKVWRKPHHDLIGWDYDCNWKLKLSKAVKNLLKKDAACFEKVESDRFAKIAPSISDNFVAGHLANTYRDVKFTMAIFRLYEKSGDKRNTFHDGSEFSADR